ncbi:hypothetical protein BHU62_20115 [Serratia marcescens]|uniref:Uncharacterized protein n=1 Tax=Serratia marcescens TaxID=615 RepID=A0A1Q4NVN4_SERMA|nr:hypothetical protein [Serratia marcescens]OKB64938.1 hypothetical protein BHU62_20115 [Serratia marcescens]
MTVPKAPERGSCDVAHFLRNNAAGFHRLVEQDRRSERAGSFFHDIPYQCVLVKLNGPKHFGMLTSGCIGLNGAAFVIKKDIGMRVLLMGSDAEKDMAVRLRR